MVLLYYGLPWLSTVKLRKVVVKNMYEIFEQLMNKHGLNLSAVSKATGIPLSTLTDWRSGRYTPKADKRKKIADFFGVTLEYLDGDVQSNVHEPVYYLNPETALKAQEMYEDPEMRALFDMKRNMDPKRFSAHVKMMQELYQLEHPELSDDTGA